MIQLRNFVCVCVLFEFARHRHYSRQYHHVAIPHREMVSRRIGEGLVERTAVVEDQVQIPDGRYPPFGSLRRISRGLFIFFSSSPTRTAFYFD